MRASRLAALIPTQWVKMGPLEFIQNRVTSCRDLWEGSTPKSLADLPNQSALSSGIPAGKQIALLTFMRPPRQDGAAGVGERWTAGRIQAPVFRHVTQARQAGLPTTSPHCSPSAPFSASFHTCGMKYKPTLLASWAFGDLGRGSEYYSLNRTAQNREEGILPHRAFSGELYRTRFLSSQPLF